ncbi:DUF3413 domain-containing protein [Thalassotalea euphylliae]|uniref:DUF3413 domain-containing protein n=1 Tax=Thalassotalea euphylliae TaxID=1655234 RepID=UPI003634EE3B
MRLLNTSFSRYYAPFVFLNFLFALLIANRYYQAHDGSDTILGKSFAFIYSLGHLGLLVAVVATVVWWLAKTTHDTSKKWWISFTLFGLSSALLLTDTFVYQQYRFHLNGMVVEFFFAGGDEVISFPLMMWLKIITVIAALIAIQAIFLKLASLNPFNGLRKANLAKAMIVSLLSGHALFAYADATFESDVTLQRSYLPLSFPTTAKSFFAKIGVLDIEAAKMQQKLAGKKRSKGVNYPLSPLNFQEVAERPDIIMIVVDSWRADMMTPEVTPNVSHFAEHSSNFTNHFSGSNNTRHGMFSLLYGIPGNYWDVMLENQKGPALIQALNHRGYQSQIFSSAKLTMPEFDLTLYRDIKNLRLTSDGDTPWQRDKDAINDFKIWYQSTNNRQPKFSLIMLDAAHGFSLPDDYEKPFSPTLEEPDFMALDDDYDATPFLNLYKNALHFNDMLIGEALAEIEPYLDNTIVIITGDHGKEFNENGLGFWGHNSNYSWHQTAVPMVVYWPDKAPQKAQYVTSHFDVVPTLMTKVLGCDSSMQEYSIGHSMFSNGVEDRPILLGRNHYYAIKTGDTLYEIDRWGNFQVRDGNYKAISDAELNKKLLNGVLSDMVKFSK